jgi:hypothetical protein
LWPVDVSILKFVACPWRFLSEENGGGQKHGLVGGLSSILGLDGRRAKSRARRRGSAASVDQRSTLCWTRLGDLMSRAVAADSGIDAHRPDSNLCREGSGGGAALAISSVP